MVANILCIFFAVALDIIGKKFPKMTGDGTQLMRTKGEQEDAAEDLSGYSCTMQDIGNGLLIMVSCWVFAGLFSKWLLPKILGVSIHQYAYLVVIAVIMNVTGILPAALRKGISKMYKFINVGLAPAVFGGMAISLLDFQSFIDALSVKTLCIAVFIIIGCIIGSAIAGYLLDIILWMLQLQAGYAWPIWGGAGIC